MAVRLSALSVNHALPQERSSGTHFCKRLSKPHGHSAVEGLDKLKKFNDSIQSGLEPVTFWLVAQRLNH
jgi:hypothetical protein